MGAYRWMPAALALMVAGLSAWGQAPPAPRSEPGDKELIAVLDLQGVQASPAETQALSDRLREVMLKTGRYKLVDRSQINAVLDEQALQQAGCTSQECAVQVGRILGVRKLVTGKVVKVSEDVWLLSAMMVDVETAETLRAESVRHKGDYFALMDVRVREIGEKMSTAPGAAAPAAVAAPPAEPATPQARRFRLALFPGKFDGQYISSRKAGKSNREWAVVGIRDAVNTDQALETTYSFYDGFAVAAAPHRISEDRTWPGLLFKEVDKDYVRNWTRDLKAEVGLVVSVSVAGKDGPVAALVYDAIKDRWYEHAGRWQTGRLVKDISAIVREALLEFKERNR